MPDKKDFYTARVITHNYDNETEAMVRCRHNSDVTILAVTIQGGRARYVNMVRIGLEKKDANGYLVEISTDVLVSDRPFSKKRIKHGIINESPPETPPATADCLKTQN